MVPVLSFYRAAYAGLPRNAWLLAVITFINRSGTMVLPFLTLYLTERLGQDISVAGLFVMLYGVGSMIGTFLGGLLTDRVGCVPVQVTSLTVAGCLLLGMMMVGDAYTLAVLLFVLGVFAEAYRPAASTLLAATCPPEQRTRAYALMRMAANLGMSVGPALGGLLAAVGYVWLFCVDGVTSLAAGCMVAVIFRGPPRYTTPVTKALSRLHSPGRDPVMLGIIATSFLIGCVFFQLFSTLPLYLRQSYGLSKWTIGVLLALNPLLVVLTEMPTVHRLRGVHPLKAVAVGVLLIGVGFGLLPLGTGIAWAALATVVWTAGEMLWSPLLAGFVANRASDEGRGRYMGLYALNFSAMLIVGPALGTAVYDWLGPNVLWAASAVIGLVCACSYHSLAKRVDQERGTPAPR